MNKDIYHPLVCCVLGIASSVSLADTPIQLQKTTVTATVSESTEETRSSGSLGEDRVSADDIKGKQASTLEEALSKNTSVEIDEVNGAQGSTIAIRGASGDAVSVRVDGAPKNRSLINHNGNDDGNTTWLDVDMYSEINVIPGVASNLYGSGSTGGVVLLSTKDPEQIIKNHDDWGAALRYGYTSNGQGHHFSGDLAKRFSRLFAANATVSTSSVDAYKDADGDQPNNGGTGADTTSYLVKGVLTPTRDHRIEMSLVNTDKHYSGYSENADDASVLDETRYRANDRTASLDYHWMAASDWVDLGVRASRSWTSSDARDVAAGDAGYTDRGKIKTDYLELENSSTIGPAAGIHQTVRVGADWTHDDVTLTYTDYINGGNLTGERTQLGAYLSDTLTLSNSLTLTGSVRYDAYKMAEMNNSTRGEDSVSPALSVSWSPFGQTAFEGLALSALVGKGYNSPTLTDMYGNTGGYGVFTGSDPDGDGIYSNSESCDLAAASVGSSRGGNVTCYLPNPDLTGETSNSYEVGLSFSRSGLLQDNDTLFTKVNYVHNNIKNRISSVTIGETEAGYYIAQYQNLERSEIHGWELALDYTSSSLFMDFSMTNMVGYDLSTDQRLEDLKPGSIAAGLGTFFLDGKGKVGIDMIKRSSLYIAEVASCTRGCSNTYYPSYKVFDLYSGYHFSQQLGVQLRIANLTNQLYTKNSYDPAASSDISYYAGRNVKFNMSYTF